MSRERPGNAGNGSRTDMVSNPGPMRTKWVSSGREVGVLGTWVSTEPSTEPGVVSRRGRGRTMWVSLLHKPGQSGCPQKASSEGCREFWRIEPRAATRAAPTLRRRHSCPCGRKRVVGQNLCLPMLQIEPNAQIGPCAPRRPAPARSPHHGLHDRIRCRGSHGQPQGLPSNFSQTPLRPVVGSAAGRTVSHSRFAGGRAPLAARRY